MHSSNIKYNAARIAEVEKKIHKLSDQDEVHWSHRSRIKWLQHGDCNTKFFHATTTQRRCTNHIKGLMSASGDWCSDIQEMAHITIDYVAVYFIHTAIL